MLATDLSSNTWDIFILPKISVATIGDVIVHGISRFHDKRILRGMTCFSKDGIFLFFPKFLWQQLNRGCHCSRNLMFPRQKRIERHAMFLESFIVLSFSLQCFVSFYRFFVGFDYV